MNSFEEKIEKIKKHRGAVLMYYDAPKEHFYYNKPFVYYKKGHLYLDGIIISPDEVEYVLFAVKKYKNPKLKLKTNDVFMKKAFKFWYPTFESQVKFESILILWHNIRNNYEEHLSRIGKHFCPKCGTKTIMYYKSFCPNCGEISLYKNSINLFQLAFKLAHKNKIEYNKYIKAFQEVCSNYSNDNIYSVTLNDNKYIKEINELYDLKTHTFYVSW